MVNQSPSCFPFSPGSRFRYSLTSSLRTVLTDGRGRHFNALMPKVQRMLKEIMGMELVLLRHRESASSKSELHFSFLLSHCLSRLTKGGLSLLTDPPKAWLLRSTLPQPLLRHAATFSQKSYAARLPFEIDQLGGGKKGMRQEVGEWMVDEIAIGDIFDDDEEDDDENDGDDIEKLDGAGVMRDAKREEGAAYGVLGTILALILVNGKVLGDGEFKFFFLASVIWRKLTIDSFQIN